MRIGIDVGGTFTDIAVKVGSRILTHKVSTTPADPGEGVVRGIREALQNHALDPKDVELVGHGMTTVTNALLERKGVRTALITTAGFRDTLEIGELRRPPEALYDLNYEKPEPLIPRPLRFEIDERIAADGGIVRPLDREELTRVADRLSEAKVQAVAVVFLFSYVNPKHEELACEYLQSHLPGVLVVPSHQINPTMREYQRTATTCAAAYVAPLVSSYLKRLEGKLKEIGVTAPLLIMQSNGGVTSPAIVSRNPSTLVLSGPAGGVALGSRIAKATLPSLITVDMGGTSTDVAVLKNGVPSLVETTHLGGLAFNVPSVDIGSIGAGGGSICAVDGGGVLRVGPESAGARPGPVCYGRGGTKPTVTDANLVLGYLNPHSLARGSVPLDLDAAKAALAELGKQLRLGAEELAAGIVKIATNNMANAVRVLTVHRGLDPRDFALMALGGAAGVHMTALADELGIKWVVVPPFAGVGSALGIAEADFVRDYRRSVRRSASTVELAELDDRFSDLEKLWNEDLKNAELDAASAVVERKLQMRYAGQNHTLTVPLAAGTDMARTLKAFHDQHGETYGFTAPNDPIEVTGLALTGTVPTRVSATAAEARSANANAKSDRTRRCFDNAEGWVEARIHDGEALADGTSLIGPCVVDYASTTIWVPCGFFGVVAKGGNLIIGQIGRAHV